MAKKKAPRKKPAARKPAKPRKRSVGNTGTVKYHKNKARDMVKEELAWLLLSRDTAPNKTERKKLTKKVRLKRIEYNNLK